jgi:hypothetical protein
LLAGVAIVAAVVALLGGPLAGSLRRLGLVERPSFFTELYFPDVAKLPTRSVTGHPLVFDFAVANSEHHPMSYQWTVYLYVDGGRVALDAGQTDVAAGQQVSVPVSVTTPALDETSYATVSVVVPAVKESIGFALNRPSTG